MLTYCRSNIIGVDYSTKRKTIWGAGKIQDLLREKHENGFSALMINVDMLTPIQQVLFFLIIHFVILF